MVGTRDRRLLEQMGEPELGCRLVALLGNNTYRNEGVLQALREVRIDPANIDRISTFV